jgi:uncharacterized protein (AIM24 family)
LVVAPSREREALEQAVVRGSELLKQGKIDEAQRSFRAALELEPDNPRVLALLGLSHFRANQLAEARPIYEQLVDRAPSDASHRLNLGLVYLKQNDADKAIAALEASRALDPSQGRAISYLGLAYARAGRYAEAYRAFLVAGQTDLAIEIETNLTSVERDRIHEQLGRSPQGPRSGEATPADARAPTPAAATRPSTPSISPIQSTAPAGLPKRDDAGGGSIDEAERRGAGTGSIGVPRTKPPSAPPGKRTPPEHPAVSAEAVTELQRESDAAPLETATTTGGTTLSSAAAPPGAPGRQPSRYSESMQFVMPRPDPQAPHPSPDGASMISLAVASASPLPIPVIRTRSGGVPPRLLSDLATDDLIRPDDSDDAFEIGANGALIIRVTERMMARLDGVHVTGGDLSYELAMRRSRGHNTDDAFDHGGSQFHVVTGRGYLIAVPGKHAFSAVRLDDDILYLREDLVFAFQPQLRWENGNVPGLRGKLPVVQFRGDGALVLRLARPLVRIKLPAQGVVFVDAERLAGWIGRVIPRAVVSPPGGPLGTMCVECTGEGVVLVEPAPDDLLAAPRSEPKPRRATSEQIQAAEAAQLRPEAMVGGVTGAAAGAAVGSRDAAAELAAELAGIDSLDEL